MSTVITGNVVLTPIAAVDTSSATNGVSMYSLYFDQAVLNAGNVIQFEYWVANADTPLPAVSNGFIPLEDAVTTQGISNQCTIAIPSNNNDYNPEVVLDVKVRVFVGTVDVDSPEIKVSEWSNTCPIHNAPPQPQQIVAYLVTDDTPGYYYNADQMYVQIANNDAYVIGQIDFVVSYSYLDSTHTSQWVVSSPISDWTRHTFSMPEFNRILLSPIQLPVDVAEGTPVYVAVNAVYNYTFSDSNYYSVSEISATVQATETTYDSPVLEPIVIPTDYSVYTDSSSQDVSVSWQPPLNSLVPSFSVNSYTLTVSMNGSVLDTYTGISSSTLDYTYTIPAGTVTSGGQLDFVVSAIFSSGTTMDSNTESMNVFTYASAPQQLMAVWANSGSSSGVDMLVTFKNPSSNGLGTPQYLTLSVFDDNDVQQYTQSVTYVSGALHTYYVYLSNVPTTDTGYVEVWMVTRDTNATTATGLYADLSGATDSTNYISDELPIVANVVRTGGSSGSISFSVITTTALVLINRFCFTYNDSGNYLNTMPFNSTPIVAPNYSVILSTLPTGDFQYDFNFEAAFFPGELGVPPHMSIFPSNSYGVGVAITDELD